MHTFNPTDTPQEKASQALKAKAALAPVDMSALPSLRGPELKEFKQAGGAGMASDVGTAGPKLPPTTGPKEVAKLAQDAKDHAAEEGKLPPGAMPTGPTGSKLRESEFARLPLSLPRLLKPRFLLRSPRLVQHRAHFRTGAFAFRLLTSGRWIHRDGPHRTGPSSSLPTSSKNTTFSPPLSTKPTTASGPFLPASESARLCV